jgi:C4-dicarboxylate-specific signal transduction histidine kinase
MELSNLNNDQKSYIHRKTGKIFDNIARIRNIIDHVRAFSRSHDDFILSSFKINDSIKNAVSLISEQFRHLGINLQLFLERDLPDLIGNTFKFEQVILNMLSNAKDALIGKASILSAPYEMKMTIKSYYENQNVVVEITDNGTGINDEDIEHITLPFYTTKDAGKGTGLGLSISYQIIREMNGTIEISSKILEGTTFKIILNNQENKPL